MNSHILSSFEHGDIICMMSESIYMTNDEGKIINYPFLTFMDSNNNIRIVKY